MAIEASKVMSLRLGWLLGITGCMATLDLPGQKLQHATLKTTDGSDRVGQTHLIHNPSQESCNNRAFYKSMGIDIKTQIKTPFVD